MAEAKILIKSVAGRDDLQRWEDNMLVKAKCWKVDSDCTGCRTAMQFDSASQI